MATKVIFDNKTIIRPGSYADIKSGIENIPSNLSFGNILIIDTGTSENFGGGAGIAGTLEKDKKAIYQFTKLTDFRNFIKGGLWWLLAEPLFNPFSGVQGVSKIIYVSAKSSTPAELNYVFTGGGSNGGNFTLQYRDEGAVGNGIEGDGTLAMAKYTVTAVGAVGDVHKIQIDEGSGNIDLGVYTVVGTPTLGEVAIELAKEINEDFHGYTAISNGAEILVTSRVPIKLEEYSDANLYVCTYAKTGTANGTADATFSAGVDGSLLTQGVAGVMEKGVVDPNKFIIKFYRGTFKGLDNEGDPYDGISILDTSPLLLVESVEFDNLSDLFTWMEIDFVFNSYFKVKSKNIIGTGEVDDNDLSTNSGNNKAYGGLDTYNTNHLDKVLDNISELDYTFILSDQWGEDSKSLDNGKILYHLEKEAKYRKYLFIGGGKDINEFEGSTGSLGIAQYYNSNRVIVVHGGVKKNVKFKALGYKE